MISLENSLSGLSDFYKFSEVTKLKYLVDKIVISYAIDIPEIPLAGLPCPALYIAVPIPHLESCLLPGLVIFYPDGRSIIRSGLMEEICHIK